MRSVPTQFHGEPEVSVFTFFACVWSLCVCVCVYMYTHTMEYYSTIKKNEILSFAMMWIDLESIMLSEISQTERDKGSVITYMWNLKNKTNVYNETETDL